eukprot:977160-Pyramimonas_sp.AAC.1
MAHVTSTTTARDHQETAGLPQKDRLSGDGPNGRGRPAQRLRLPTPERRRRRRRPRLWHSRGKPATAWKHAIW